MADAGKPPAAKRPAVAVPSRSNAFSFATDASPGPVTLASSFFGADTESDCGSFRQLLAGAMGTESGAAEGDKMRKTSALGSASFSSPQVPSGMSHQQVLAEVTAQAAWSSSRMIAQAEYLPTSAETETSTTHPSSSPGITFQQMPTQSSNNKSTKPTGLSLADGQQMNQKPQQTSFNVDKPADDGYHWRKYGQKLVKGSDSPRSYYKCTHPNCPVKKKVQHSLDGHVTEIIYKGQHNHQRPPPGRRTKESNEPNGTMDSTEINSLGIPGSSLRLNETQRREPKLGQPTTEQSSCSSDGEDGGDDVGVNEPEQKRRNIDAGPDESDASHKTVTEPRVIVQTTSAVDLLDDGYKWRKYGQKVVKGNCHPRSYYKCTYAGCSVRKHVERASTDPKAVITTYEGKHNHDIPPPRNSSHNTASTTTAANVIQPKAHNATNNQGLTRRTEFGGSDQHLNAIQKLKEENHNI